MPKKPHDQTPTECKDIDLHKKWSNDEIRAAIDGADTYLNLPFPVQRLWSHFLKAYKVVLETMDREVISSTPLTLAEFELMMNVEYAGGRVRLVDLSRITLLSQSQVSRRVDGLQAKGYLVKEIEKTDRRVTYAVMTASGYKSFMASQRPLLSSLKKNFLDKIPLDRIDEFGRLLELLVGDSSYMKDTTNRLLAARRDRASRR